MSGRTYAADVRAWSLLRSTLAFRLHVSALLAQTDFFRQFTACLRVIRRCHGIIRWQLPTLPILLRGHVVVGFEMPLAQAPAEVTLGVRVDRAVGLRREFSGGEDPCRQSETAT